MDFIVLYQNSIKKSTASLVLGLFSEPGQYPTVSLLIITAGFISLIAVFVHLVKTKY
jgi:hypothetical protein